MISGGKELRIREIRKIRGATFSILGSSMAARPAPGRSPFGVEAGWSRDTQGSRVAPTLGWMP
jgi:hypothetical protein